MYCCSCEGVKCIGCLSGVVVPEGVLLFFIEGEEADMSCSSAALCRIISLSSRLLCCPSSPLRVDTMSRRLYVQGRDSVSTGQSQRTYRAKSV